MKICEFCREDILPTDKTVEQDGETVHTGCADEVCDLCGEAIEENDEVIQGEDGEPIHAECADIG